MPFSQPWSEDMGVNSNSKSHEFSNVQLKQTFVFHRKKPRLSFRKVLGVLGNFRETKDIQIVTSELTQQ